MSHTDATQLQSEPRTTTIGERNASNRINISTRDDTDARVARNILTGAKDQVIIT